MVIHDLRNPTNQVEFLVSQSVKKLKAMQAKYLNMQTKLSIIQEQNEMPKKKIIKYNLDSVNNIKIGSV
jgi:hypothetical protein